MPRAAPGASLATGSGDPRPPHALDSISHLALVRRDTRPRTGRTPLGKAYDSRLPAARGYLWRTMARCCPSCCSSPGGARAGRPLRRVAIDRTSRRSITPASPRPARTSGVPSMTFVLDAAQTIVPRYGQLVQFACGAISSAPARSTGLYDLNPWGDDLAATTAGDASTSSSPRASSRSSATSSPSSPSRSSSSGMTGGSRS